MPSLSIGLKLFKNNSVALNSEATTPIIPQNFASRSIGDDTTLRITSDGFARRLTF